jgi:exonuclease III
LSGTLKAFNFVFWNCHGFRNVLNLDAEQYKMFNRFSVIGISETWSCSELDISNNFPGYNIIQRKAVRENITGRARGGLMVMLRTFFTFTVLDSTDSFIFLKLTYKGITFIVGLIYLRLENFNMNLNSLKLFLQNNVDRINRYPVIIGGDFNSRLGELNQCLDDNLFMFSNLFPFRQSHDKIVNVFGRKLIDVMNDCLFILINGRAKSDSPGSYTFINNNGKSTIDLIWINSNYIETILDIVVSDFVLSSDHLPVIVKTNVGVDDDRIEEITEMTERLNWLSDKNDAYKFLMMISQRLENFDDDTNNSYSNLVASIKQKANQLGMIRRYSGPVQFRNKPWYDLECNVGKRHVRQAYRAAKKRNFSADLINNYLSTQKAYKLLLKNKKCNIIRTCKIK